MDKKVLIIDDEPDVAKYLTEILKDNGYTTYSADNADIGMEVLESIIPDLICLDIMMPMESGISMYVKIRKDERFKHIPVLIISGVVQENEYDFRSYVSDKSIPPPDYFFEKPISVAKFMKIVDKFTSPDLSNNNRGKQDV
ncbi:MAG: response regulator [candidate division Zixibacteria bacterium]|nr:response regulator [candidate division Zixibacteria bacterium]